MNRLATFLCVLAAAAAVPALAQNAPAPAAGAARQDPAVVRQVVEQFLATQTAGLPGQVAVKVGQIDGRASLAACAAPQAFLPNGSRAWGRTTVGVRCSEPVNWTIYVPATVQVMAEYLVTARPLAQGQPLGEQDVTRIRGDLATLPAGIVTDASQVVGRTLAVSLQSGAPVRQDALRSQQVVQQGQMIRLVTAGPGFKVSTEGRALNNAMDGQVAQARLASGQVISGVARAGGVVEVTY